MSSNQVQVRIFLFSNKNFFFKFSGKWMSFLWYVRKKGEGGRSVLHMFLFHNLLFQQRFKRRRVRICRMYLWEKEKGGDEALALILYRSVRYQPGETLCKTTTNGDNQSVHQCSAPTSSQLMGNTAAVNQHSKLKEVQKQKQRLPP